MIQFGFPATIRIGTQTEKPLHFFLVSDSNGPVLFRIAADNFSPLLSDQAIYLDFIRKSSKYSRFSALGNTF
jgi:hypothetical protein